MKTISFDAFNPSGYENFVSTQGLERKEKLLNTLIIFAATAALVYLVVKIDQEINKPKIQVKV